MARTDFDYMSGEQYLEEILRQAIRFEEESYALYTHAIQISTAADAQAMLEDLAAQELGHKQKLQRLQAQGVANLVPVVRTTEARDLKLAEVLQAPSELDAEADLQDVLLVAMQREKSTREFYLKLGQLTAEGPVRNLFDFLAEEELKHKQRVESLYEQLVYREF